MSEPLIVATYFGDVAELTENFADRVEEGQIILYGPMGYELGERIPFQVLLADESAALEGSAVVLNSVDAGEERDPEYRYDIVLGELDLIGASEAIFERLLAHRRGEVSTSVALDEEIAAPASEVTALDSVQEELPEPEPEPAYEPEPEPVAAPVRVVSTPKSVAPPADTGPRPVSAGSRGAPPPTAPRPPGGFAVELGLTGALGRPVMPAAWTPEPPPREPSTEPTGQFEYGAAVPIPARPPRPEMDPARRVEAAPMPTTEGSYRAAREALGFGMPTAIDGDAAPAYQAPAYESDVTEGESDAYEVGGDEAFDVESTET